MIRIRFYNILSLTKIVKINFFWQIRSKQEVQFDTHASKLKHETKQETLTET